MTFYKTPECCILIILNYLTRSDILTTRKVCKTLNVISNTPTFLFKIWSMLPYEKAYLLERTKLRLSPYASMVGANQTTDKHQVVYYFFNEQVYFGVWRQPVLQSLTLQYCQILRDMSNYYPCYAIDPTNGKLAICFFCDPDGNPNLLGIEIYQGSQKCCDWTTEFLDAGFAGFACYIQIYKSLLYFHFKNRISVYENGKYKKSWPIPAKEKLYDFHTGIVVAPSGRLYYWNNVTIWYKEKGKWILWNYSIDVSIQEILHLIVLPNVIVVLFQLQNEYKRLLQVFNHSGRSLFSIWPDIKYLYRFYQVENTLIFMDEFEVVQYSLT
jgi:hypothetical protein